jgi:hypothetical protein
VPFYGFGTLQVVAQYDIGALGSATGPAVLVESPLLDSLRSVVLWFVLLGLLFRRPNRNRQAWALVPALGAIFLILRAVESQVNAGIGYYWDRHASEILFEMLRWLAGAMAVLFALADLIPFRSRPLRFPLVFLILFGAGAAALSVNTPIVVTSKVWIVVFGIFLLLFLLGHTIVRALLASLTGPRQLSWAARISLLLGAAPLLVCAAIGLILSRSSPYSGSALAAIFRVVNLSQAILGPYFVLSWFLLLGLLVPLYRRRLAQCFGYSVGV